MGLSGNYPEIVRDAGFKLRQFKDGPLDWRLMGSYEIERILREQNIEQVDNALYHLAEAPLGSVLDTNILDSGIAKYFVMSQYAIQYLLFCRKFLDETVSELKEAHGKAQLEIAQLRKSLAESNNELVQLNKKITQIEAIHEVVYPCHLCTKNFISNEALNIHIGRKHSTRMPFPRENPQEPSISVGKEQDADRTLINTIKMELEIKQLKERLNVAEKNIKERNSASSKKVAPHEKSKELHSIGIQSDLIEAKEKDDIEIQENENVERKEQIHELQERIFSFETWQMCLKQNNEEFIETINKKLEGLTTALEQTMHYRERAVKETEHRTASPSVEQLERLLVDKVQEVSRASAAKLEEIVQHMELDYKAKLAALERELKQLNTATKRSVTNKSVKMQIAHEQQDMKRIKRQVESQLRLKRNENERNCTTKEVNLPMTRVNEEERNVDSLESNHTYTKELEQPEEQRNFAKPHIVKPCDDVQGLSSTDISETLDEGTHTDETSSQTDPKPVAEKSSVIASYEGQERKAIIKPRSPIYMCYTRRDAKKMLDKRLAPLGFDMKSQYITAATKKRIETELAEKRSEMRMQNPKFYTTRNRIKLFVDKLCSAKLPANAESVLKHKTPLQPMPQQKNLSRTESDTEEENNETSTNLALPKEEQMQQAEFRNRLEQLLTTPTTRLVTAAQVHKANQPMEAKPVPLPRKRVMFSNTGNGKTFNDSE